MQWISIQVFIQVVNYENWDNNKLPQKLPKELWTGYKPQSWRGRSLSSRQIYVNFRELCYCKAIHS